MCEKASYFYVKLFSEEVQGTLILVYLICASSNTNKNPTLGILGRVTMVTARRFT